MGKSGRAANNARLAALKAEQERQERRRKVLLAGGTVAIVALIALALILAKVLGGGSSAAAPDANDAAALAKLTSVKAADLDAVGAGTSALSPKKLDNGQIIKDGDKPRILYVGGEYCPYCALERYPMVVALSRFGTFTGLGSTNSDPDDNFGVPIYTPSFHGSSYTSDYIAFTGVEMLDNKKVNGQYGTLDSLSADDDALWKKFNAPPYVDPPGGAIPWTYFGGTAIANGAGVDKALLEGQSMTDITTALADPTSDIAKTVLGHANVLTAQICRLTDNKPADVCTSAGVKAGAGKLAQ